MPDQDQEDCAKIWEHISAGAIPKGNLCASDAAATPGSLISHKRNRHQGLPTEGSFGGRIHLPVCSGADVWGKKVEEIAATNRPCEHKKSRGGAVSKDTSGRSEDPQLCSCVVTEASTAAGDTGLRLSVEQKKQGSQSEDCADIESPPIRSSSRGLSSSDGDGVLISASVLRTGGPGIGPAMVEDTSDLDAVNGSSLNMQWQRKHRSSISPVHQSFDQGVRQLVSADA